MPVSCNIEFENSPSYVTYSGQLLKGVVIVRFYEGTDVRGVYLRLIGGAFIWLNPKEEAEKYLDEKIVCFDGTTNGTRLDGTHCYPFECHLNSSIPTSLEEDCSAFTASIRYKARIHFDEHWDTTPAFEKTFTIIKPLNLPLPPNLRKPFVMEFKKRFCYCCFCSFPGFLNDTIKMVGRLPQQVYASGVHVELKLDVYNESDEYINAIEVKLVRKINVFPNIYPGYKRENSTELCSEEYEGCEAQRKDVKIYRISIVVPSTPPSEETGIIKVSYEIQVTAVISACYYNLQMEIPIIIGAYPVTNQSAESLPDYYDPPIYEEAVYCKGNKSDGFKPKYPVNRQPRAPLANVDGYGE